VSEPPRLIVTKREARCAICASPQADVINGWLGRRGERLPGGETITLPYILENVVPVVLGRTLSETSARRHLRNHVEVVDGERAAEAEASQASQREAALDPFERILGPKWQERPPSVDALLELQRALYARTLADDVRAGRPVKLSHDQFIRGAAEATRRKQNEATGLLLRGVADGLSQVFTKALSEGSQAVGELEPSAIVIVDAEDEDGDDQ
jgi:hypothetical protein